MTAGSWADALLGKALGALLQILLLSQSLEREKGKKEKREKRREVQTILAILAGLQ